MDGAPHTVEAGEVFMRACTHRKGQRKELEDEKQLKTTKNFHCSYNGDSLALQEGQTNMLRSQQKKMKH